MRVPFRGSIRGRASFGICFGVPVKVAFKFLQGFRLEFLEVRLPSWAPLKAPLRVLFNGCVRFEFGY